MQRKIVGLLVLLVLAAGWAALLWFVVPIPWQGYRPIMIVLLHAIPPLAAWLSWQGILHTLRKRLMREAAEREVQQAAEREANLQAAKSRHDADMTTRRFACHCRYIAVQGMAVENFNTVFPRQNGVDLEPIAPLQLPTEQPENPLASQQLHAGVANALSSIYGDVPAAMTFPIYVALPSDMIYGDEVRQIRDTAKALIEEFAEQLNLPTRLETPRVIAFSEAATPADAVLSVFEQRPDLAGMIALAFDSPRSRKPLPDNVAIDLIDVAARFPEGLPTYGLVGLCCTSPRLGEIIDKIAHFVPRSSPDDGVLLPYWEQCEPPAGDLALLGPTDLEERQALREAKTLAVIHRCADTAMGGDALRPLERIQRYQSLMESCFINGGLIETPFAFGGSAQVEATGDAGHVNRAYCRHGSTHLVRLVLDRRAGCHEPDYARPAKQTSTHSHAQVLLQTSRALRYLPTSA